MTDRESFVVRSYQELAWHKHSDKAFFALLLACEVFLCLAIVLKVPYTEIDWIAYMQEVSTWQEGELDYRNIRGDTGPLVYPAGFLYLFGALKWVTNEQVKPAQYIFVAFYIVTQIFVWMLYQLRVKSLRRKHQHHQTLDVAHQIWSWRISMAATCLSKRLHSIFLLRLFNDGPTMMLLYASIWLFTQNKWNLGCFVFSLAVSLKMNILLFAPGLLLLLLQSSPNLETVVFFRLLGCCALPQLILGAPFLLTFPVSYLRKAFELDRVFFYKWTVNWKFLPEDIFLSKPLAATLLLMHIGFLIALAIRWIRATRQQTGLTIFLGKRLDSHYIVYTMLVSNFIGIAFARTLHYQFYCWYFHALPYILWAGDRNRLPIVLRMVVLLGIERAFLTFPATPLSSAVLQSCHTLILWQIRPPSCVVEETKAKNT